MSQSSDKAGLRAENNTAGNNAAGHASAGAGAAETGKSDQTPRLIAPGSTVGILGGGQLGRMLANAGSAMGYRFVALDPTPDCPMGQVSRQITAAYDDEAAARELAAQCDVITYEFENVDAGVAAMLTKEAYVPQGSALLHTTQHRLREKRAIEAAGATVAPYREITSVESLAQAVSELGLPAVFKTATGGYDGKGQWVIRSTDEIEEAYATLSKAGTELVLEQFISFQKEISVIAARSSNGEIKAFPAAENIHVNNILHLSIVPARIEASVAEEAERLAVAIAEGLGAVGLIAVEMFVTEDGRLFVNELAPRPHNSGHYTMEASKTCQFEQHIRAICGLPLGDAGLLTPVVMVNVLGQHVEPTVARLSMRDEAAEDLGVTSKLHLYGKKDAVKGRKMGHVNVLADSTDAALRWIEESGIWNEENKSRKV